MVKSKKKQMFISKIQTDKYANQNLRQETLNEKQLIYISGKYNTSNNKLKNT